MHDLIPIFDDHSHFMVNEMLKKAIVVRDVARAIMRSSPRLKIPFADLDMSSPAANANIKDRSAKISKMPSGNGINPPDSSP